MAIGGCCSAEVAAEASKSQRGGLEAPQLCSPAIPVVSALPQFSQKPSEGRQRPAVALAPGGSSGGLRQEGPHVPSPPEMLSLLSDLQTERLLL